MTGLNVVFDCADPGRVAEFWLAALPGYTFPGSPKGQHGAPPEGFESWVAWADAHKIPEELRHQARTIIDEEGDRPDIHFIRVPEPKSGKNRLHLDVKVGQGLEGQARRERQDAEAARLVAAGATMVGRVEDHTGSWLVLRDVEGNEFCLT